MSDERLTNEERIKREQETYAAWLARDDRVRRQQSLGRRTEIKTEAKGKRD
jgi:hypothetical protein